MPALEEIAQARVEDGLEIFAAAEGQAIELRSDAPTPVRHNGAAQVAERPEAPASDHAVLLGLPDSPDGETIADAAVAEEIELLRCSDPIEVIQGYGKLRPSMVILPHDEEGLATARSVRAFCDEHAMDAPILLVGEAAGPLAGLENMSLYGTFDGRSLTPLSANTEIGSWWNSL